MTNNERKYRTKIIQENHLNKETQRKLDEAVKSSSYQRIYLDIVERPSRYHVYILIDGKWKLLAKSISL